MKKNPKLPIRCVNSTGTNITNSKPNSEHRIYAVGKNGGKKQNRGHSVPQSLFPYNFSCRLGHSGGRFHGEQKKEVSHPLPVAV